MSKHNGLRSGRTRVPASSVGARRFVRGASLASLAGAALLGGTLGCNSRTYSFGADAEALQTQAEAARQSLQRADSNATVPPRWAHGDSNVTVPPAWAHADSNVTTDPFASPAVPPRRADRNLTPADRRAVELAASVRAARDEGQRAALRAELAETLETAFEERREREGEALRRAERQLQELRAVYNERGALREEIIERRRRELLGEPDVLAWDLAPLGE